MPSRMVATNLECHSICNGAWSAEKSVSATAPAAACRRPPKARRRLGCSDQVHQREDLGQEQHPHANDEDEEGLLRGGELGER